MWPSIGEPVPKGINLLLIHGPYDKFLPVLEQIHQRPNPPKVVFWNTEGLPDLRHSWSVMKIGGALRSWVGRTPSLTYIDKRFTRFRYLGDFLYAQKQGWIDLFVDISSVYAELFTQHGLPTLFAPFGAHADWHSDLKLERDIDVLWMGTWGGSRRRKLLHNLRDELRANGVRFHIADNVESPFIFDDERTEYLNRAKITVNLLRTWYDENSLRFCLTAPNRSLIITEPLLNHVPYYQNGRHYIATPPEQMAQTILYYLENESERRRITENAYQLMTQTLTLRRSLQKIMAYIPA